MDGGAAGGRRHKEACVFRSQGAAGKGFLWQTVSLCSRPSCSCAHGLCLWLGLGALAPVRLSPRCSFCGACHEGCWLRTHRHAQHKHTQAGGKFGTRCPVCRWSTGCQRTPYTTRQQRPGPRRPALPLCSRLRLRPRLLRRHSPLSLRLRPVMASMGQGLQHLQPPGKLKAQQGPPAATGWCRQCSSSSLLVQKLSSPCLCSRWSRRQLQRQQASRAAASWEGWRVEGGPCLGWARCGWRLTVVW